jgi:FKBP-type peptidyl-prolyl cis-trans isomerase 2
MQQAGIGDRVTVHYIGTLDNGRIFDSRDEDAPLVLTLGKGEVFPALEEQIVGMKVGQVRNILLSAEQAYGPRLKENMLTLKRDRFPVGRALQVGQKLSLEFGGRSERLMLITRIEGDDVTLDGNHALAGCDLTFALRLVAID